MNAFALDFDGVICNSIAECCSTSYTAFKTLNSNQGLSNGIPSHWVELFYANRGLVRPASDYLKIWKWIVDDPKSKFLPLKTFNQISCSKSELATYAALFFQIRKTNIHNNKMQFVRDNPFYPEILKIWNSIPFPKYVVTAKDEDSTRLLLEYHEFEVSGLFTHSFGPKPMALQEISRVHGIDISKVRFVDDNPEHVEDCRGVGATCKLVGWGYGPYFEIDMPRINSSIEMLDFFNHE